MAAKSADDVTGKKVVNDNTRQKKIETQYSCKYCQFSTTVKKNSEKHRKSKQHIRNEIKEEDHLEITIKYACVSC